LSELEKTIHMNAIQKMGYWGETHHPAWLDVLRVALGMILLVKGILFLRDTEELGQIINHGFNGWSSFAIVHYVAFAHLFGGILVAFGLLTRLACIINLPILIGALIFINSNNVLGMHPQLALTLVTFVLLIVFIITGSGPYSLDHYYRKHKHL
jgi:uncharacterized membrane protein YphA (DoxX/SURF4 family)